MTVRMGRADKTSVVRVLCAALVMAVATEAPAEIKPAELPSAGYRGLQYIDSRGCAFIRAGTDAKPLWVPRVSSGGAPLCGNPPSGKRVPIAGEAGADTTVFEPDGAEAAAPAVKTKPVESKVPAGAGGYVVAVGSFGVVGNADKAMARLMALGYPTSRGWLQGGSSDLVTVFAGPYDNAADAQAARTALRGAGFPEAVVLPL